MTNKSTTFKRISLALVAALSLGVLGSAQSNALLSNSQTLTLSASTASAAPGETATVTATVQFTSDTASESLVLSVDDASGGSSDITENAWGITTDSANVNPAAASGWRVNTTVGASTTSAVNLGIVSTSSTSKVVVAKTTLAFLVPTNATAPASYVYTVSLKNGNGNTLLTAATFTLTVTARDTTATAAKSKFWLNQAAAALPTKPIEADSALVVSAGASRTGGAPAYTNVGYIYWDPRNASDTNIVTGTNVTGSLVLVISGPGLLVDNAAYNSSSANGAKSVTLTQGEYASIVNDGNAGVATITAYIGSTALTQGTKSITFVGKAVTLTATANTITAGGGNLSSDAADSITTGTDIITFVAKDSAGNAVTAADQNRNNALYCISSDTSVVGASTTGAPTDTNLYVAASYNSTLAAWECNMTVRGKGTATITAADSFTVASSAYTSSAISITAETKTGYTGTISFDKASYNIGDVAIITVTSKAKTTGNTVGMNAAAGNASNPFTGIVQNRPFSGVKSGAGFNGSELSWNLTGSTFVNGVETYVVYMPNTAGKVTLTGFTSYDSTTSNTAVNVSVDVVDPLEAVIKAQVDAAKAAADAAKAAADAAGAKAQAAADAAGAKAQASADAATDAALQAIDAANAATDAANLAAEAADAATVAAQESKDAADAATAAVESLATQVATLMAALQAQITSLANVVAKIAKKVKA